MLSTHLASEGSFDVCIIDSGIREQGDNRAGVGRRLHIATA